MHSQNHSSYQIHLVHVLTFGVDRGDPVRTSTGAEQEMDQRTPLKWVFITCSKTIHKDFIADVEFVYYM